MARVIDCPCGHILQGQGDEELFQLARKHVDEDHPEMERTDDEVRGRVAATLTPQKVASYRRHCCCRPP